MLVEYSDDFLYLTYTRYISRYTCISKLFFGFNILCHLDKFSPSSLKKIHLNYTNHVLKTVCPLQYLLMYLLNELKAI